jgi:hypothetical protein
VRAVGAGEKLRMELGCHHKGMVDHFGNFHQAPVWGDAG